MVTTSIITTGINAAVLALTPIERWHAARRLDSASTDLRLFIILCVVAIILLIALLIVTSYSRRTKERKVTDSISLIMPKEWV
jgi:hypothetical protein